MTLYNRVGDCNRCGQCCGAEGSPEQRNPWPKSWPFGWRWRALDEIITFWPQALLFGIIDKGNGQVGKSQDNGTTRISGGGPPRDYYWVWIDGHAVCKDTSPGHDGASYSLECPFLIDDPGDGTRSCGLVGTNNDNDFRVACEQEPQSGKTVEEVAQWQARHPLCSYTWEAE
jgi:hypothetical protein